MNKPMLTGDLLSQISGSRYIYFRPDNEFGLKLPFF